MSEQDSISRSFKAVFAGEEGKRVLEHLKSVCYGNYNQSCFAEDSDRRTYMRLGANSVYRYIMTQIERKLGIPKVTECQTERETQ
jgi:hypothetical protein